MALLAASVRSPLTFLPERRIEVKAMARLDGT